MRAHISKCTSIPSQFTEIESEFVSNPKLTSNAATPILSECHPIHTKQSHLTVDLISTTNSKERESFDKVIALFFYSCNIPFNVADNQYFKNMVHLLRPSYKPPNSKLLGKRLLDGQYDLLRKEMCDQLKGKDVYLLEDGWSDIY